MLLIEPQFLRQVQAATTPEALHGLVQSAIELEHATIPPYLCAYFTLKPGTNAAAAEIIRSVVIEEMLHMSIASNLLIALGGAPRINRPGFIPRYPGPLPMNIGEGLVVGLRKCSIEQIADVFMKIEEPEDPLEFPVKPLALAAEADFATIGQFYAAIADKIDELGPGAFKGDFGREVIAPHWFREDELFRIVDPQTARAGIELIVEQGEGTPQAPVDPEGEVAHYYRFQEIVKGRRLVKDPSVPQGWSFSGDPVSLETNGIWNMQDNPAAARYPAGTRARRLADQFNYSYTVLLNALHAAFNGAPQKIDEAMGVMYELRLLAQEVLATPAPGEDGVQTGLPFEYAPLDR